VFERFEAVRRAARGGRVMRRVSEAMPEAAGYALPADDLPILGMLVEQTAPSEIARVMQLEPRALSHRLACLLSSLQVQVPEARD